MISCEKIEIFCNLQKKIRKKRIETAEMTKHEKFWIFAQVSKLQKSEAKERESLDLLLRRNDEFECLFSVLVKKNITYIKKSAIDKKTNFKKNAGLNFFLLVYIAFASTTPSNLSWNHLIASSLVILWLCPRWALRIFLLETRFPGRVKQIKKSIP